MLKLVLAPNFKFRKKYSEIGKYIIILPQKQYNIIMLEMDCTSMAWAIQDVACYLNNDLEKLLGTKEYEFIYAQDINRQLLTQIAAENEPIDVKDYFKRRKNVQLPAWNKDKDKYRYFNLLEGTV